MVSLGVFRLRPIDALNARIPARIRAYRPGITFSLCALLLVCSILLGGGTRGGFLSDAILELIAIPVLLTSLSSLIDLPIWRTKTRSDALRALAFCSAIALLPLIQLVPLPPWIWAHLPGREQITIVFELLGDQTLWMPISIAPRATWLSWLSLLPPLAIFLTAIQLTHAERRGLSLVIVVLGVVSLFVGLSQVAEGPTSLLRFFAFANETEAVGFFANRNHFAALLYAVLLFAAVWAIDVGFKIGSWKDLASFQTATILALTAIFMVFIAVIAGEAMARSRAGLALTMVALLAVFALTFMDKRNRAGVKGASSRAKVAKLLFTATLVAVILTVQFAVYRILDRFATDPLEDVRTVFARNTITAAKAFMPFGSGSGTFVPVYQLFEKPTDTLPNIYVNHAHNDFLELWLETGVLGPLLLCLFVIWLGLMTVKLWRRPGGAVSAFNCTLGRAATVVIALLLAHSLVDYPMRTEAIMAIFAVCCALLIAPVRDADEGVKFAASLERYLAGRKAAPQVEALARSRDPGASPPVPTRKTEAVVPRQQSGRRWGTEIDWPEEWRNSRAQTEQSDPKSDTNSASKVDSEG